MLVLDMIFPGTFLARTHARKHTATRKHKDRHKHIRMQHTNRQVLGSNTTFKGCARGSWTLPRGRISMSSFLPWMDARAARAAAEARACAAARAAKAARAYAAAKAYAAARACAVARAFTTAKVCEVCPGIEACVCVRTRPPKHPGFVCMYAQES